MKSRRSPHAPAVPCKCTVCGQVFYRINNATRHGQRLHGARDKQRAHEMMKTITPTEYHRVRNQAESARRWRQWKMKMEIADRFIEAAKEMVEDDAY